MNPKHKISVFIASPGDLAVERRTFKEVIEELNNGFGDGAGVEFIPLGWEDTLAATGRRPQSLINKDVDRCDVFILVLHRRWGQEAPDAKPYASYTEEEFHRALDRWKKTKSPEILVFFKDVDPASMADPGEQLKKVLVFRKQLDESRKVFYRFIKDETKFRKEIDTHLRAFAKGELPKADEAREIVVLPITYVQEVEKARKETEAAVKRAVTLKQQAEENAARAELLELTLAEQAAQAALVGRLEEARQEFAKASERTTNLRVLFLTWEFYHRTGELNAAEQIISRWLALSGPYSQTTETSAAYGNLGLIFRRRGKLDEAEAMHKKALAIEEKLGSQDGMAANYSNLGVIYQKRGELDKAEAMHKKALAISEKLGLLKGMAIQYSNLGVIYQKRGELDKAEAMHKKSLAIEEKHGRPEDMAIDYSNLGMIYQKRGKLDKAEAMHKKALAIEEKLGNQEGMAAEHSNLGLIYQEHGELDKAEAMHKKALAIADKLGLLEGMAIQYSNLGAIAERRSNKERTRELWVKARDLYTRIGMPQDVKEVQGWLDRLDASD